MEAQRQHDKERDERREKFEAQLFEKMTGYFVGEIK